MAGKPLAHRGTGGTSLTSEDDAVPDIDTNNVCEEFSHQKLPDRPQPTNKIGFSLQTSGLLLERLQG